MTTWYEARINLRVAVQVQKKKSAAAQRQRLATSNRPPPRYSHFCAVDRYLQHHKVEDQKRQEQKRKEKELAQCRHVMTTRIQDLAVRLCLGLFIFYYIPV